MVNFKNRISSQSIEKKVHPIEIYESLLQDISKNNIHKIPILHNLTSSVLYFENPHQL